MGKQTCPVVWHQQARSEPKLSGASKLKEQALPSFCFCASKFVAVQCNRILGLIYSGGSSSYRSTAPVWFEFLRRQTPTTCICSSVVQMQGGEEKKKNPNQSDLILTFIEVLFICLFICFVLQRGISLPFKLSESQQIVYFYLFFFTQTLISVSKWSSSAGGSCQKTCTGNIRQSQLSPPPCTPPPLPRAGGGARAERRCSRRTYTDGSP